MQVTAKLKNLRIAPRKVKLTADLIKGMDAREAISQLERTVKRSSEPMRKLLSSALSNGENNLGLDKDNLYVFNVLVGAGPMMKRWMPKAFGRAGQILKRTSQVTLILEERVEGKNRKTKEQMEKEKKERLERNKKEEKEAREKHEEKEAEKKDGEPAKENISRTREAEGTKKESGKKTWGSRIFRRKSM